VGNTSALAYLLAVPLGYGASRGIGLAMAVSMVVQSIGMTLRFRNGGWKKLKP